MLTGLEGASGRGRCGRNGRRGRGFGGGDGGGERGEERIIGRDWSWIEEDHRMAVTGGDGGCGGGGSGQGRRAEVAFECGLEDELIRAEEPTTCVYEFTLRTPAACV